LGVHHLNGEVALFHQLSLFLRGAMEPAFWVFVAQQRMEKEAK